jgi:TPR repeat protein
MYAQGQGVKRDAGRARGQLQRAKTLAEHYCRELNDAWGCEIRGDLDGGAKSARSWYARAADRYAASCNYGDSEACHALLRLDLPNKGIPWDGAGLRDILQQACDRGILERCIDLANMYLQGTGVEKDQARGHDVLRQLCSRGETPDRAREFYRRVACELVGAVEFNAQQQK